MDNIRFIVFSDWSGWCSKPLTSSEQLDYDYPANVRTAQMPASEVPAFVASVQMHADRAEPINWSAAQEV